MRIGLGIGLNNTLFKEGGGGGNVAPSNVTAPVISGSTSLGSVLTTTNGTWSGTPATFSYTYQWKRNGSPIGGATSSTYTTVVADSTANITCDVTADNGVAPTATAGSNTLTMANYTPANTVPPAVTGTAVVGQTLSTTNGTWTNSPSTFSYQWRRNGVDIGGATASTYTLVSADAGANIICRVTASNGLSASADSNTLAILDTPLDMFGNSAIGLSASRLLRGAYYGSPIVRLRRSGDNAESDFGVTTLGVLDNSAVQTWINAGGGTQIGFVITIYDQTGNARHFTQSTPTNQPKIRLTFGVNNRAALLFDTNLTWLQLNSSIFTYTGDGDVYISNSTSSANAGAYPALLSQQSSTVGSRTQLVLSPQYFNNANVRPSIESYGGTVAAQSTASNTALNEVVLFRYKWQNYSTAHSNGNTVISKNDVGYTLVYPSSATSLSTTLMRLGRVETTNGALPQFFGSICEIIAYTSVNINSSSLNSNMRNFVGI